MNDRGLRALIKLFMLLGVVCQQDDDFSCSSFHSLALALTESKSCTITAPEIVIRHELHVRAGTTFSVDSTIDSALSGNGSSFRLFSVGNGSSLIIRGLTLAHAHCRMTHDCFGGAIFASHGSFLTLDRVRVSDSSAISGGALYAVDSRVVASGCTFESNSASDHGGAITAIGSTDVATDCLLTSNKVGRFKYTRSKGGAIYAEHSSVVTTACTFDSNSASYSGGAIHAVRSNVVTDRCNMSLNEGYFYGGALFATADSNITTSDCEMTSNSGHWGGAVASASRSTVTVIDCKISSNAATSGGAFYAYGYSTLISTGCVMTSNFASGRDSLSGGGGALLAEGSSNVTMTHCTMISNSAYFSGGAVLSREESFTSVSNCTALSNIAMLGGGGAFSSGDATGEASLLRYANDGDDGVVTVIFADSTMASNSATSGGALYLSSSAWQIVGCLFSENSAVVSLVLVVAAQVSEGVITRCILRLLVCLTIAVRGRTNRWTLQSRSRAEDSFRGQSRKGVLLL